jgi:glycosyltransferase involved in cell wall biosynthesis
VINYYGKMKGIQVIKSLEKGGAEVLLRELFQNKNFKANNELWLLTKHDYPMLIDFKKIDVKIKIFGIFGGGNVLLELVRLINQLRKNKPQYVHSHLPWAGILIRFVKFFAKFRSIYTEHNQIQFYKKTTYLFNRYSYFLENKIICCSNAVQMSLPNYWQKHSIVIDNGIDLDKFYRKKDVKIWKEVSQKLKVITVGRMSQQKMQIRLIKAIAKIPGKIQVELLIVGGDGGEEYRLKKMVKDLKIAHRVIFAGEVSDVLVLLKKSHVFALSSKNEGLPISLLEATAVGCIPLCTNVGGIPLIYEKEQNLLIKSDLSEDQIVNSFAGHFINLANKDEEELLKLSNLFSEVVKNKFDINVMRKNLEITYAQL